ncbi:PREDICTED: uncharacterized protein LOC107192796 [Dufourea novaeangliae]|uniref:Uncharacterized protein n=1 Tax=Dufourea novaeangliae TaxID=178035 RepID=A0A154NZG9_DUFNO|nr:PREDICTED: uncharacterized protein LOC107192796 [Dufourea novaeangliae]KZC04982.1 hypothetical protein WN55_09781 [Dufourea novaeangliae]
MYAAAGGASIANRRKQKRLQLNKRVAEGTIPSRLKPAVPASSQHHYHHHQYHSNKFARPHVVPPSSTPQPPPSSQQPPSSAYHHQSVERRRHVEKSHQQIAPVSPIQFPISPPPLSLESPSSVTCATKSNNNFPFPPPSILDLRVSPSSSELQCGGGPGKAAWQGCSRPSPLPLSPMSPHGCRGDGYKTKQCEAHRRWMKRNRIRDASYCYESSGEDDEEDGSSNANRRRGEVSAAVNTVLYAGLGTTALGLVISFVGTGEKGFLSPELRLVGPSLLCAGLLCCLFRVLLCLCLCHCGQCRWQLCNVASDKKDKVGKPEARPAGTLPTASLLSPTQQQQPQQPQQQQSAACSSGPGSSSTKAHELLLSPAQLPE